MASLTKPVFSYLVLDLYLDGQINIDTPLIEYWGKRYIDHDWVEVLTARHILSHQSGWPNWSWTEPLEFQFQPGSKFQYSGEGIIYLQRVVAKVMETKVFRLLQNRVFGPLGMTSSGLTEEFVTTNNRVRPFDETGKMIKDTRMELKQEMVDYVNRMPRHGNAAGTMWSSITDYTTFMHHLVTSDETRTTEIRKLMLAPQVHLDNPKLAWGVGIGIDHSYESPAIWHWGSDTGFKSFTISIPQEGWGLTLFTNGEKGAEVYREILNLVLPELPAFVQGGLSGKKS